jgi:hypothetical protein
MICFSEYSRKKLRGQRVIYMSYPLHHFSPVSASILVTRADWLEEDQYACAASSRKDQFLASFTTALVHPVRSLQPSWQPLIQLAACL